MIKIRRAKSAAMPSMAKRTRTTQHLDLPTTTVEFMGFRSLRVINEDRVAPGKVLERIRTGTWRSWLLCARRRAGIRWASEILGPNEIQRMSAGSGVIHSEFNGSKERPVHFFQIWIEPASRGTPSSYEQIRFDPASKLGKLKLLAGPKGGDSAATINQDAYLYVAELGDRPVSYDLRPGRHAWLQVVRGDVTVNGAALHDGDAAAISAEESD